MGLPAMDQNEGTIGAMDQNECAMGALPQLKTLYLNSNNVGNVGMSALAGACASGALTELKVGR